MTNDELIALAERVEALSGGDRGVDASIWYALVEKPRQGDRLDKDIMGKWPTYTASLDAAISLLPSNAWFIVKNVMGPQPMSRDMFVADVLPDGLKDRPLACNGPCSATPAIALTAAAIRAHAAIELALSLRRQLQDEASSMIG